jgi:hypothetical protein
MLRAGSANVRKQEMKHMKRLSTWILASAALALAAPTLLAERAPGGKTRVVTREANRPARSAGVEPKATAAAYSAQANIVTRVQGTSFFRTAIDITNNTSTDGVIAQIQYCYTLNNVYQFCTPVEEISLLSFDNFHTDDIVEFLGSLGILAPGAEDLSFGTLLVTFQNLPSNFGWEGTVTARTYSPVNQANPALGTVAIAYPGSLFFESANVTLVGTIRDTRSAPTAAGALRTNLGVTNTDLNGTGPVDVELSFFDVTEGSPTNGQLVGNILSMNALESGEVRQINNIWAAAGIPANVQSVIAFVDTVHVPNGVFPTIEGYANILDGGTQDGAYFELKCADTDLCGN